MLIYKIYLFIALILLPLFNLGGSIPSTRPPTVPLTFYTENLDIPCARKLDLPDRVKVSARHLKNYYQQLLQTDDDGLLDTLLVYADQLRLNDWLLYQLIHRSVEKLYDKHSPAKQEIIKWFLLSEAGYNTRLTYRHGEVYLYVQTDDQLFEVPIIEDGGYQFVNLTAIQRQAEAETVVYMVDFFPRPQGRSFSFYLTELPKLQPLVRSMVVPFQFRGRSKLVTVNVDTNLKVLMDHYPLFAEAQYLEVPLSEPLQTSLVPALADMMTDFSLREKLEFLVSFTRSAFVYQEDEYYFGRSKPMIPDEVFLYPYSDCEDRSALFYALAKSLIDLPMIIIAFPNHLTVGISLEIPGGDAIPYNGRLYYICDPTGPANSSAIGKIPNDLKGQTFEIIGSYK